MFDFQNIKRLFICFEGRKARVGLGFGFIVLDTLLCWCGKCAESHYVLAGRRGEELIALTRRIINDFEEKYPDVTVNYQVIPWAEDPHVCQTAILGGTMADVFSLGDPFQHVLAAAGL